MTNLRVTYDENDRAFIEGLGERVPMIGEGRSMVNGYHNPDFWRTGPRYKKGELIDPYTQVAWIFASIRALQRGIASVPFKLYTGKRGSKNKTELSSDSPWAALFESPCPLLSQRRFWHAIVTYLALRGECYVVKISDNGQPVTRPDEMPAEIWPQDPAMFVPVDKDGRTGIDRSGNVPAAYIRQNVAGGATTFLPFQVVRFSEFNPSDLWAGQSSLEPALSAAAMDYAATIFNKQFFENGMDPGGIFTHPKDLNEKQLKEERRGLRDAYEGLQNRGKTLLLHSGITFSWNPRQHKDAEFTELRRMARDEMIVPFGVTKSELSITEDLNYATYRGQHQVFIEQTILPQAYELADTLWSQLFKSVGAGDVWGEFDADSLPALNEDFSGRVSTAAQLVQIGWTPDQANERLKLNMPKTPPPIAGDDPLLKALSGEATSQEKADNPALAASMIDISSKVTSGTLTPESAKQILMTSFPSISEDEATIIVEGAVTTTNAATAEEPLIKSFSFFSKRVPRQISDRKGYIGEYLRAVLVPTETKMTATMRRYLAALQTEQSNRLKAWLKSKGLKPGDLAKLSTKDIDAILFNEERWNKAIEAAGKPHITAAIKGGLASVSDEVGGFSIPVGDPRVSKLSGDTVAMLVVTNKHSQNLIRADFEAAAANGETIAELQARIAKNTNFDQARALRIARTETGMASSGARFVGMEDAEVEKHEWVNAGSGDIREQHQDKPIGVGGEIVVVGEKFSNGMRYPHEIGSDASDVCNCRCEALGVL